MTRVLLLLSLTILVLVPVVADAGDERPTIVTLRALVIEGDGERRTIVVQPALSGVAPEREAVWLLAVPAAVTSHVTVCGKNTFGSLAWVTAPPHVRFDDAFAVLLCLWLAVLGWTLVWYSHTFLRTVRSAGCVAVGGFLVVALLVPNLIQSSGPQPYPVPIMPTIEARQLRAIEVAVLSPPRVRGWLAERGHALDADEAAALDACAGETWHVVVCRLAGGASGAALAVPPPLRLDVPVSSRAVLPRLVAPASSVEVDLTTIAKSPRWSATLSTFRRTPSSDLPEPFHGFTRRPSLSGVAWPGDAWISHLRGRLDPVEVADLALEPAAALRRGGSTYDGGTLVLHGLALLLGAVACVLCFRPGIARVRDQPRRRLVVIGVALAWPALNPWTTRALVVPELHGVTVQNTYGGRQELRAVSVAQTMFREGDKENDGTLDYGTLEELSSTTLIDGALGSGTKLGYRFTCAPHPETPEFLWSATASPTVPTKPAFFVDHTEVIRMGFPLELGGHADDDDQQVWPPLEVTRPR